MQFPFAAGSSASEPGITPAQFTLLTWPTWTDWVKTCGDSRVDAGLHFPFAVEAAYDFCPQFGVSAYEYAKSLYDGTAPKRGVQEGKPVSSIPKPVGPGGKPPGGKPCKGNKC